MDQVLTQFEGVTPHQLFHLSRVAFHMKCNFHFCRYWLKTTASSGKPFKSQCSSLLESWRANVADLHWSNLCVWFFSVSTDFVWWPRSRSVPNLSDEESEKSLLQMLSPTPWSPLLALCLHTLLSCLWSAQSGLQGCGPQTLSWAEESRKVWAVWWKAGSHRIAAPNPASVLFRCWVSLGHIPKQEQLYISRGSGWCFVSPSPEASACLERP